MTSLTLDAEPACPGPTATRDAEAPVAIGSTPPLQVERSSLADISSAYDSPEKTIDGWVTVIARQTWLTGDAVRQAAGPGPLITDDHPRPEYFLLRRLFGAGLP